MNKKAARKQEHSHEQAPPRTKRMHALDSPVQRGQEEEEKRDSPEGRLKISKDTLRKRAGMERKVGRTDLRDNVKSGEKDAHQQEEK